MKHLAIFAILSAFALPAWADDDFQTTVQPILAGHCYQCHGEKRQKGELRLDTLPATFADPEALATWERIRLAIDDGEMPPDDEEPLSDAQNETITRWIDAGIRRTAEEMRHAPHAPRTRRLSNAEYDLTLQTLFGVAVDFSRSLPPDPISDLGYQNDVALLTMSPLQMEYYLEIARAAVLRYVVFDSTPAATSLSYRIEAEDVYYTTQDRVGTMQQAPAPLKNPPAGSAQKPAKFSTALAAMPPGELPATEALRPSQPKLHQQFIPLKEVPPTGDIVVRIRAAASPGADGSPPRLRVEAGVAYGDGDGLDTWRLGEMDVTAPLDQPAVYEFRTRLEDIPIPRRPEDVETLFDMVQLFINNVSRDENAVYQLGPGSLDHPQTASIAKDSGKLKAARQKQAQAIGEIERMQKKGVNLLHLDAIEIEIVTGAGIGGSAAPWRVKSDLPPREAAAELLRRFLPSAWRRPVSDAEISAKLTLFDALSADAKGDAGFEDSLRETLVSALASPNFLLVDSPDLGASNRLASRLAYFLWNSPPDESLRQLGTSGELAKAGTASYASEASRLLDDPRSAVFLDSFCRQWLRLDKFPLVAVNPEYFPGYDDDFAAASLEEPRALFREVYQSGASALELIDPGYAMLNDRLARHYGLPTVTGGDLRKVAVPADGVRGGLIGQAALLTMNADGVDSHPIRRGVWIVDRLLGSPPPPPPSNVPDLDENDPDFRGLTLKQRIEKHRDPGRCRDCHQRFDPWGITLENFDAIGQWRETVSVGTGTGTEKQAESHPIDALAEMPDGSTVDGAGELIRHLRENDHERFTRSMVHQLMTYALGRKPDLADRLEIGEIHQRWELKGLSLRDLILEITASDAFTH